MKDMEPMKKTPYARRKELSMSPFTKVVCWFRAANALALFGLIGVLVHWLQRRSSRPWSEGHRTSDRKHNDGVKGPEAPTNRKETR